MVHLLHGSITHKVDGHSLNITVKFRVHAVDTRSSVVKAKSDTDFVQYSKALEQKCSDMFKVKKLSHR